MFINKKSISSLLVLTLLGLFLPLAGTDRQVDASTTSTSGNPSWLSSAVIYEVNVRQYTKYGTFKAFAEHLPRLKNMGVNVLWFMPIHPISKVNRLGSLGSYYAVADYKAVNPEFGTSADFKALVDRAHQLGFKVVLDWVANHTGWDNPWIQNKSWYTQDRYGNIIPPEGTGWNDVADLNYDNASMRAAMIDAMKYWVQQFGIDGYRCDAAGMVPVSFWNTANTTLQKIKPLLMLAEDADNLNYLQSAFRMNYGWSTYHLMNNIVKEEAYATDFEMTMLRQERLYPTGTYPMQFITNHDENSWTGTEYERLGAAVPAMTALTFAIPGIPLIYSGQEEPLKKRLAFFDKDQIMWGKYANQALLKKLIALKKTNRALWNGQSGGPLRMLSTNNDSVIAFQRYKSGNRVMMIMNASRTNQKVTIEIGSSAGTYSTFSTAKKYTFKKTYTVTLKPWSYEIYTK